MSCLTAKRGLGKAGKKGKSALGMGGRSSNRVGAFWVAVAVIGITLIYKPLAMVGIDKVASAAKGAVNDRFDVTGVASKKLAGTADGKIGQGIDKTRDAGSQAVDQDDSEYGKMAAAGAVGGQIGGLAAGKVIPGVDAGKFADAGGKIGKAATGGVIGMGETFHAEGGTEGLSDVATGARNAGENAVSSAKGSWDNAADRFTDSIANLREDGKGDNRFD